MKQTTNFYEWITAKAAEIRENGGAEDPAEDFIMDADSDSFFPQGIQPDSNGFISVFLYIYYNRHASGDVIDAFMECWENYHKDATGCEWIDPGYNAR